MKSRTSDARRGAAAVEFALVLPLLLVPLMTVNDFARVYRCTQVVADSARTGAMYLSNPDVADKSPYATVEEAILASASDLKPAPTFTTSDGIDGQGHRYYEVTVTYVFHPIMSTPPSVTIKRTVRARMYPAAVLELEM